jgi:cysteine desulfurase/selenocysteine lyase
MNMTGSTALLGRDQFLDLNVDSYLYTGAHSPALRLADEAMQWAYRQKSAGPSGRQELFDAEERARASIGKLVGRPMSDVAFTGDASTLWSSIANGWEWKQGDNIVVNEYEHPSGYAAWLRLKKQGLEVRVVRRDASWGMSVASIAEMCDERTVAIVVSHVGYVSGLRHDLDELAEMADARGIPVLLDASHSLGVVPVDASKCAIVISASYKWLLGPYGVGIVVWNQDRLPNFVPGTVGWRSVPTIFTDDRFERWSLSPDARRFQTGAPAFSEIAALGVAVEQLLAIGGLRVEQHALTLSGLAHDALTGLGLEVVTPRVKEARAGNVAFLHPRGEEFAHALERRGVFVWGGDGRVRASFHVMNDDADIDKLKAAVADALKELPL